MGNIDSTNTDNKQSKTGVELKDEMSIIMRSITEGDEIPIPNRSNLLTVTDVAYRGQYKWKILAEDENDGQYYVNIDIGNPEHPTVDHAFSLFAGYKDRQQKVGKHHDFERFAQKANLSMVSHL